MEGEHRILPDQARSHRTHIEGKDELFETKLFKLSEGEKHVLVLSRDPGSASALLPVLKLLKGKVGMSALIDGRAQEAFKKVFPEAQESSPKSLLALTDERPDIILTDSSTSERGIETNVASIFAGTPAILIEDYYGASSGYLDRLKEIQKNSPEVVMPLHICVMDEGAREILSRLHPEISERIVVTGQPAFDKFATEDTAAIRERVREELALHPEDALIAWLGILDQLHDIERAAPYLAETARAHSPGLMYVVYRKHPRDNTPSDAYKGALAVVPTPEAAFAGTNGYNIPTSDISAAADIVITSSPTSGLEAAMRRIPVVYVNDAMEKKLQITTGNVPALLGAAVAIASLDELPAALEALLQKDSERAKQVRDAMERHYRADGKNAERVADVLMSVLR